MNKFNGTYPVIASRPTGSLRSKAVQVTGKLSGASIAIAGHDTGSLIIQLNVLAKAVVEQAQFPVIDIDGLRDLNKHLATTQGHANDWLNSYSGQLWNRLQGLITFGETFTNLYKPLYAAAQRMALEDQFQPNEISRLISALQALRTLVNDQAEQSKKTYDLLSTYRKVVAADHSTFLTDYNTAQAVLGGTKGEIAQLQKKIEADQDALNKDLSMIAGGSTMMVVGILCIAVGALAEIETVGASTILIVAGIGIVAGGATMTGIAGKNYDDTMKHVADEQKRLANDRAELTLLNHANSQLTGINNTLEKTTEALGNLVTSWQQLDNSIGAVITDLQNPEEYLASLKKNDPSATPQTVSIIVSAELETANQDWTSAVNLVSNLLAKGRNIQYVTTGSNMPTQDQIAQAAQAPQAFLVAA